MDRLGLGFVVAVALLWAVPGARAAERLSLAGEWKFILESTGTARFFDPDFDDSAWPSLRVPGHWETQGFGTPSYARASDEVGLYRRAFTLPPEWRDRRVFLSCESVYNGCRIYLNGREVAYHEGAHTPFQVEISEALRPEGENLLALRVAKLIPHSDLDDGDFWQLGGIYRPIELFAVRRQAALRDYLWQTPPGPDGLSPSGRVVITASLEVREAGTPLWVRARILQATEVVAEATAAAPSRVGEHRVQLDLALEEFRPWSAETPQLYRLELALFAEGETWQTEACRIGFRVVARRQGALLLNGRPLTLRGVCLLDIWPDVGRAVSAEMHAQDVEMMLAANINCVRPGWVGVGRAFLELCDEKGLYVIGEAPFSNVRRQYLDDPGMVPEFLSRTREAVGMLARHPSVILYSVGNENGYRAIHPPLLAWIRRADPSRLLTVPYGGWASYPDADVLSWHYPSLAAVQERLAELAERPESRPILFTEYAHALFEGGGGMEALWERMERAPEIAGGCRFNWNDQGLRYRRAGEIFLDSRAHLGTDGIVSSDRAPQPEYFQTRAVYCPIRVLEDQLDLSGGSTALTVENRHDFIDLSGFYLRLSWRDGKDGAEVGGETLALPAIAPRASARLLPRLRPHYADEAAHLHVTFMNPQHRALGETALPVRAPETPRIERRPPESPRLLELGDQWRISAGQTTLTLDRDSGQLIALQTGPNRLHLSGPRMDAWQPPLPHLQWRGEADTLLDGHAAEPPLARLVQRIESDREVGGVWRVETRYEGAGWPHYRLFVSAYRTTLDAQGEVLIYYTHTYLGRKSARLRRWGVAVQLLAPRNLIYHGRGPLASYPDKWMHAPLGAYLLPLAPGASLENRHACTALRASPTAVEDLVLIPDRACGLRVEVDEHHRATLALAPLVGGIGDKGGVQPMFQVSPRELRTCTGALRLSMDRPRWWRLPPPVDWPEHDDGDAWPTSLELAMGTSPFLADTDGDGVLDSEDPDPLDPDVPHRRLPSMEERGALAAPPHRGEGWFWVEGEAADETVGCEPDLRKAATTSLGGCLGGFRRSGDVALYLFRIEQGMKNARLALRYARGEDRPVRLSLRLTHAGGMVERELSLPPTGGWGLRAEEWALAEDELGPLAAGALTLELIAGQASAGLNLDGFYLMESDLSARVGLSGNLALPPR